MGRFFSQPGVLLTALFWGWISVSPPLFAQPVSDDALLQALQDNYSNLQNARDAYEQALGEGRLIGQEKTDYRNWIQQLGSRVLQNCLELAHAHSLPLPEEPPCEQILAAGATPVDLDLVAEKTPNEKTTLLVDEMNQSLGAFDERLLREQDRVRAQKPRSDASTAASSDMAGAGTGAGAQGQGDQQGEAANGEQADQQTAQGQAGQQGSATDATQGATGETSEGSGSTRRGAPGRPGSGKAANVPDDIPDGSDDDIVARQLREAAEKEQDPELREKLWEEYRRYKAGTR